MTLLRRAQFALVLLLAACADPAPTTGALILSVDGLPAGAVANVSVTGPNGYVKAVQGTVTLEQMPPGTYTVRIAPTSYSSSTYAVAAAQSTYDIVAGKTENAAIHYQLASGAIDLAVAGLPTGISPNILLRGPFGFRRSVLQGGLIGELPAGTYAIQSDTITTGEGDRFGSSTYIQNVTVPLSTTAVPASVAYALTSGTLDLTVDGLTPVSSQTPVTVSGPNGFQRRTSFSMTLRGIAAGTYTITAPNVSGACPTIYSASNARVPLQITRDVALGQVATASISYTARSAPPEWLNLRVDAVNLTQVTQNYPGTVPMVTGRPALLRVHGMANQCNSAHPKVRLTMGGTTVDLTSDDSTVATVVNEAALSSTWNYVVPGSVIQPGLSIVAEIDPTNQVAEFDESDNRVTKSVDVRTLPVTRLKIVPVTITGSNTTGGVTTANVDEYMRMARKLHPVGVYDVEVKPTFTASTTGPLQANNTTGWGSILSEIRTLQTANQDGYYYGVVKVTYTSGVAGIGYIGAPAALGWDYLPSAANVLAHELGHNFGRFHSPCGNPLGIDPDYPNSGFYSGGYVGTYGYDPADSSFKNAAEYTDVMGYCNNLWISDYTYINMMNWVIAHPMTQPSVAAMQPSLLVWGRIVNGEPVLEPAFEISARPQLPASGPNRLTALDERGAELFSIPFAADRIADLPGDQESFAIALPITMLRGRVLAALRLTARGRVTVNMQAGDVGAEPDVSLSRAGAGAVRLRWDATRFPVIMVRDPVSGDILSFARGGDATVVTGRPELELNYSNRVRSARRLLRVR